MKRILFASSLLSLALAGTASATPFYTGDNGVVGGAAGYLAGNSAIVGNYFVTDPGRSGISAISVYWGQMPGGTMTLGIVDDPNGDGSLADGVVVQLFDVTVGAGDIGSFVTYDFAATQVSGGFFVGAYINAGPGGTFPVFFDSSGLNFGGSRAVQGAGTFLQLAQGAPFFPNNATWMIRADAVPEPATLALMGSGLLIGVRKLRRRKS
jgi:hypothetical protein